MRPPGKLARDQLPFLRLGLWADPGARVPKHFHPPLEERFEVREGEFTFTVGRRKHRAGPGERLVVPPGVPHAFTNTGPRVAHFVAESRADPKLRRRLERLLREE